MAELQEIIASRRSIRKFTDAPVSEAQIRKIIDSGVHAPSGCNSQCWHFTVVTDREKLREIAAAVEQGVRRFYDGCDAKLLEARLKQTTWFQNAPACIFVFMTAMPYHDPRVTAYYAEKGYSAADMCAAIGSPDILSIGAAVQNMLLTIHEMGLGACWMNDPIVAAEEICAVLQVPEGRRLMSVIPFGTPAYTVRGKELKPMDEILDLI